MLSSLKILDFTGLIPGPFASRILADLGADVINIEDPKREDILKKDQPQFNGKSIVYEALNRNKKLWSLDLTSNAAKEKIYQKIIEFDIVLEGNRPGVMQKLGFGYDKLYSINKRIIYCSLTGYGQKSPIAQKAGHDINFLSLSSIPSFSGKKPFLNGIQIADIAGGSLHAVIAILAAVIERQKSGEGQKIDVAMLDCTLSLAELRLVNYLNTGKIPKEEDHLLNGGSYYDYYTTKDNRYLSIGSLETKFFDRLLIGLKINENDFSSMHELKKILQNKIKELSLAELKLIFANIDACVEPVLEMNETFNLDHIKERQLCNKMKMTDEMEILHFAHPIKYSRFEPSYKPQAVILE